MRTLILALTVILFAAPVWATVTITAEMDGSDPNKIWIGYTSDEAELIRAFALDITAIDGNIVEVNDYSVGDDNGGYGIFPGSFAAAPIVVNATTGQVDNWAVAGYSPVAPAGDPDALGGVGTSGVTVEMGSLYDTAAPSQTEGILCSVTVDGNASKLCVSANAIRGNVVLESAAEVQNLVLLEGENCFDIPPRQDECITSGHPDYAEWVAAGKPKCWCYPRQCYGDADGQKHGTPIGGYFWVGIPDLNIVSSAWLVKEPPKGPGISAAQACADFTRSKHGTPIGGYFRVGIPDLNIMSASWLVKEPPKGTGILSDCSPGTETP